MQTGNVIPERIADAFAAYPPFTMMDRADVARLASSARVRALVAGEYLFKQGDPPGKDVIFLHRGRVEYHWAREDSSELVAVRDVGDVIGVTALIDGSNFRVSAKVAEDCLLYVISGDVFMGLIASNDEARYYVRRHMFWATRVGGKISIPEEARIHGKRTILQAHMEGGKLVSPRPLERLLTCRSDDTILSAAEQMVTKRVSSILVVDEDRCPLGIVTNLALMKHTILKSLSADLPVSEIMVSPVYTISKHTSTTAAILLMMRERVGQICITEDGTTKSPALDVCTHKDLLAQSGNHPAGLLREMRIAKRVARLREICDEIEQIARGYLDAGVSGIFLGQMCAELYDGLVERLSELAILKLEKSGKQLPDVSWAWMSVGSDGRREQVLRTDMDNALIFESTGDAAQDDLNRGVFLKFTTEVVDMMVDCGFSRCQGGVMASNARWCRTDAEWEEEVLSIQPGDGDAILRGLILFDLRCVTGSKDLCLKLRSLIFDTVKSKPLLLRNLAELAVETKPPLSFWGKFMVERKGGNAGEFDIKSRGLSPLRDAARIFALQLGLTEHYSTGGRFEEIKSKAPALEEICKLAYEAYDFLLRLRNSTGLRRGDTGRYIEPSALSKMEKAQLSNVFDVSRMVQSSLRSEFRLEQTIR
ncbi:DUF294 nucleotidyltransferase-like domain-containing protein [Pelagicoccus albus]|uniref:Cyclic nucleotide-binding domain-containing protein n=1 Tax=Pelagicoccus albus TaxID=415222 RepID=A0A7X1B5D2_9BACT|nr:DUF294 nucleotidyltransferase-like domain-containing protein [Pelagicoccus albus]MBC2605694.1 cyclic nucleotide-binding domain-containing protein [Pelagicoccus albus]